MLVLPNDWVEGSQCSPPVSNDDNTNPMFYYIRYNAFAFACFAPARVKVKHYDYDPIGTWGK